MLSTIILIVCLAALFIGLAMLDGGADTSGECQDWIDHGNGNDSKNKMKFNFSPTAVILSGPFKRRTVVSKSKTYINTMYQKLKSLQANLQLRKIYSDNGDGEEPDSDFLEALNNI